MKQKNKKQNEKIMLTMLSCVASNDDNDKVDDDGNKIIQDTLEKYVEKKKKQKQNFQRTMRKKNVSQQKIPNVYSTNLQILLLST